MSGALAERDFVEKMTKAGFGDIRVVHRAPWGLADCALYPLFGDELMDLMRELIPSERHDAIGQSIVVTAQL